MTQLRTGRDWQLFLTTAIENANDAIILYERSTRHGPLTINYVNRMFEEHTGYSRAEAIGRERDFLFGPLTDRAVVEKSFEAIHALQPVRGELLKYRKDGSTYWVEFNTQPLLDDDGALAGAVAIERDITARKRLATEHERIRTLFDAVMANTKNVVYIKDLDGCYLYVNREYERLHGMPAVEVVGKTDFDIFPEAVATRVRENDRRALASPVPISAEETVSTVEGDRTFLSTKFTLKDEGGVIYATCGMSTNIHERVQAMQRLELLEFALDHGRDAVAIFKLDADGRWRIRYVNAALSSMTGYRHDELIGQTSDLILGPESDTAAIERSRDALKSGSEVQAEWLSYRKDGSTFWLELNATPLRIAQTNESFTIVIYRDVTKKKEEQEQLSYEASHDALTGLFNRRYLERAIERGIFDARSRLAEHGLVMLDLDGFKSVNDRYGHEAGDKLLAALSILMGSRLRRGDVLARLGGDEFAVILLGCSADQSHRLATEIVEAIAGYAYPLGEHRLCVSASAGITMIDAQSISTRDVLRAADEACYAAKRAGKNRVAFEIRSG